MKKDIRKIDYINYLVEVKGHSEEEARKMVSLYGVKCVEKAFDDMKNKTKIIAKEQGRVFDRMFTLNDIKKGNTLDMEEEARKIAIKNLKLKGLL